MTTHIEVGSSSGCAKVSKVSEGLGLGLGWLVTEADGVGEAEEGDGLGVVEAPEHAASAPTTQASIAARTGRAERRTEVTIRHRTGVPGPEIGWRSCF